MTDQQAKTIEHLNRLRAHLYKMDYKDVCIDLGNLMADIPVPIFEAKEIERFKETHPRDKSIIYRARENEKFIPEKSDKKLPFKTLDEISIISDDKKHLIKKFGRCNKPEEPRFYSSNNYTTACAEAISSGFTVGVSESKMVTVGSWRIKEPLVLAQINYSESSLKQFLENDNERYEQMLKYTRWFDENHLAEIKKHKPDSFEYQHLLSKRFADEFARNDIEQDYDYKLINYYCDNVFDNIKLEDGVTPVDGIVYPSIDYSYQEKNLVLHPRAMKKIEFISAMNVWVVYHGEHEAFEFIPLEQNVKADELGNLLWRKFNW